MQHSAADARCSGLWAARLRHGTTSSTLQPSINTLWGEGTHLTYLLDVLRAQSSTYKTFVDIGAAVYNPDDKGMGTFKFISTWKTPTNPIIVHAFDVSPSQLESHALVRSGTVRVHRSVVSNREGEMAMYGTGATATINTRLLVHRRWENARRLRNVSATTLDALASREHIEHIDLLKIDAEGAEWEILQGADGLLSRQSVSVILLEYSSSWSASTYYAAFPVPCMSHQKQCKERRKQFMAANQSAMQEPTLRSVTRHLADRGYDAYMVGSSQLCNASARCLSTSGKKLRTKAASSCRGSAECAARLQLIPLSRSSWDDAFELAFDSRRRFPWLPPPRVWFDVVAVRRRSAEHKLLRSLQCSDASERTLAQSIAIHGRLVNRP